MWIESYTANGRKYYRARRKGWDPIHLGSWDAIVRKVRPELFAKRTKEADSPTNSPTGAEVAAHEPDAPEEKGGFPD